MEEDIAGKRGAFLGDGVFLRPGVAARARCAGGADRQRVGREPIHAWTRIEAQQQRAGVEAGKLVLSSDKVGTPTEARYAWQAKPKPVLFNGAELPASPFQIEVTEE